MAKILIGGAGGAPSEGVINSLLLSKRHEEIIGMGSVPSDLVLSHAKRKYVVPYANDPTYEDELLKVLDKEHPDLIHFQNDLEVYYASKIRNDIQDTGTKVFMPRHEVIETCVDKWKSWQAFKKAGLIVPENLFINSEDDLKRAFKELSDENGSIWLRANDMGGGGMGSIPTNDYHMATLLQPKCLESRPLHSCLFGGRVSWLLHRLESALAGFMVIVLHLELLVLQRWERPVQMTL